MKPKCMLPLGVVAKHREPYNQQHHMATWEGSVLLAEGTPPISTSSLIEYKNHLINNLNTFFWQNVTTDFEWWQMHIQERFSSSVFTVKSKQFYYMKKEVPRDGEGGWWYGTLLGWYTIGWNEISEIKKGVVWELANKKSKRRKAWTVKEQIKKEQSTKDMNRAYISSSHFLYFVLLPNIGACATFLLIRSTPGTLPLTSSIPICIRFHLPHLFLFSLISSLHYL